MSEVKTTKAAETDGVADMNLDGVRETKESKDGKEAKASSSSSLSSSLSLDDAALVGELKLTSKELKDFVVEKKSACISNLIKTSLEQDAMATEVPVPGVTTRVMTHIAKYMDYHKGTEPPIIEKPLRSKVMKDVCKEAWDAEFIDAIGEDRQLLYDLILAANYMDIPGLLHLGCAKVASLIKGQPLEKIKEILSKGIATPAADEKKAEKKE